jgi:hypothetical protein
MLEESSCWIDVIGNRKDFVSGVTTTAVGLLFCLLFGDPSFSALLSKQLEDNLCLVRLLDVVAA